MKKSYKKPIAKMVTYEFNMQVTAEYSFPIAGWADPGEIKVCTHNDGVCYNIYNVLARGVNSCKDQGQIPGVVIPPDAP